MEDRDLIRKYALDRSDAAFAELVDRHKNWIYSACLRRLRNPHLAEDATQAVFIALAQKAASLKNHPSLIGWLHQATRFVTANVQKVEARRNRYETEVAQMKMVVGEVTQHSWDTVAPHLEPALDRLPEKLRTSLLLRFYQQKSLAEIAGALNISEPAAQKRVSRGLELLRAKLTGHSPAASSLSILLSTHLLMPAPASLSTASITASLAATTGSSFMLSQGALHMMYLAKLKALAVAFSFVLVVLGGGAVLTYVLGHHETAVLADSVPATDAGVIPQDSAQQRAAFVAPFLHENTLVVIHLDANTVNFDAISKATAKNLSEIKSIKPDELKKTQAGVDGMFLVANSFVTRFKQAGGRHAYILIQEPVPNSPNSPVMLFPLEANADPKALAALLASIPGLQPATLINDHLLAICEEGALKTPAVARPDLQKALTESTGDVQVAIALSNNLRELTNHKLDIPSFKVLVDSVQYLTCSINLPPNDGTYITLLCDTEENAKASAEAWNTFVQSNLERAAAFGPPDTLNGLKDMFLLTQNGKTLKLEFHDSTQAATALAIILPAMGKVKSTQNKVIANALKKNLLAAMTYASDNNGIWPASMQTLVDGGYLPNNKTFVDPLDAKHRAFEYHPFNAEQTKILDAGTTPVIWEPMDSLTVPISVGYLDGHVETLGSKSALNAQLEVARLKLK